MADFKAGDVVRLKSGGPRMTVSIRPAISSGYGYIGLGTEDEKPAMGVFCVWFAKPVFNSGVIGDQEAWDGNPAYCEFAPEALIKAE